MKIGCQGHAQEEGLKARSTCALNPDLPQFHLTSLRACQPGAGALSLVLGLELGVQFPEISGIHEDLGIRSETNRTPALQASACLVMGISKMWITGENYIVKEENQPCHPSFTH